MYRSPARPPEAIAHSGIREQAPSCHWRGSPEFHPPSWRWPPCRGSRRPAPGSPQAARPLATALPRRLPGCAAPVQPRWPSRQPPLPPLSASPDQPSTCRPRSGNSTPSSASRCPRAHPAPGPCDGSHARFRGAPPHLAPCSRLQRDQQAHRRQLPMPEAQRRVSPTSTERRASQSSRHSMERLIPLR